MNPDDEICYCYHVSMRKLVNFSRRVRPRRASQMTECLSAGTGCGWCIPFLRRIAEDPDSFSLDSLDADAYAEQRSAYRRAGGPKNSFRSDGAESSENDNAYRQDGSQIDRAAEDERDA